MIFLDFSVREKNLCFVFINTLFLLLKTRVNFAAFGEGGVMGEWGVGEGGGGAEEGVGTQNQAFDFKRAVPGHVIGA